MAEILAYENLANRPLQLSLSDNWSTDSEVYNLEYYRTEGRWDIAFDTEYSFPYLIDSSSHLVVMQLSLKDADFILEDIMDGLTLNPTFKAIYEPHAFILADVSIERGLYFTTGETKIYLGQDSEHLCIVFDSSYLCNKR